MPPVPQLPSLCGLPLLPINPAWLEQSAAFQNPDARIALGYMRLLFAAWRGSPAASIPGSHAYLSTVTGLPAQTVGEHFAALTEGYELRDDGRLHHVQLANLLGAVVSRYGAALDEFMLSSAMAMQSPEQFALVAVEGAKPGTKGKRVLPKGFGYGMFPKLRDWARTTHFPEERDQDWIMEKFLDYCNAKNPANKDWESAFRIWADNEVTRFRAVPPSVAERRAVVPARVGAFPGGSVSPFAAMARGRGEVARDHNAAVFGAASQRRAEPVCASDEADEVLEERPRARGS